MNIEHDDDDRVPAHGGRPMTLRECMEAEEVDTDRYTPPGWSIWGLVSVALYAAAFWVGFAIGSLLP